MGKTLNIAVVGTTSPPVLGGLEVYTFELARQMANAGHRVFLIGYAHHQGATFKSREIIEGVEIFRLPSKDGFSFSSKIFYFWKVFQKLRQINAQFPIDLIHANTVVPAGLGGYLFKTFQKKLPLVVTSHGYEVLVRPRNFFFKFLTKLTFKKVDFTIGVSQEVAQASIRSGANPAKTVNWCNPVDTERFRPDISGDEIRNFYKISDEEKVILSLRRLHPKTGVKYLIESAAEIARECGKIKFLIVGDGILKDQLIKRVAELGLEEIFIFAGAISNELVPQYIAASNLAIFPSLAEATSIACLEVMAGAKPVIASDVGGLPEIIVDGYNGILIAFPKEASHYEDFGLAPEIVHNLARAIITLVKDDSKAKKLGQAGLKEVHQNYSWQKYLLKLTEVYEKLVNEIKVN